MVSTTGTLRAIQIVIYSAPIVKTIGYVYNLCEPYVFIFGTLWLNLNPALEFLNFKFPYIYISKDI